MKNIHILPTDKPSRLVKSIYNDFILLNTNVPNWFETNLKTTKQNIYITSDEEIKVGDWCIDEDGLMKCTAHAGAMNHYFQKIILTTDADLIKDGVQTIPEEFLEWFTKNPSCEEVKVESKITKDGVWTDLKGYVELPTTHSIIHKIIIPKEENIWKK